MSGFTVGVIYEQVECVFNVVLNLVLNVVLNVVRTSQWCFICGSQAGLASLANLSKTKFLHINTHKQTGPDAGMKVQRYRHMLVSLIVKTTKLL